MKGSVVLCSIDMAWVEDLTGKLCRGVFGGKVISQKGPLIMTYASSYQANQQTPKISPLYGG